ncbi:MAG: AMP-binding protein [Gammaproteobacteria bacterium]|nr:AMP-binding protein [Gammaproteobacteria bacterium]
MFDVGRGFLASVARAPNAIALVDGQRRWRYCEWLAEVRRVATGIEALPVSRGEHLVVVLQNRAEMTMIYWACQLLGIVFTPINWRATGGEIDFVLGDANARALVFESVSAEAVAGAPTSRTMPRVALDAALGGTHRYADWLGAPPHALEGRIEPDDTSIMLYTSGTTGRGKGVPRSHGAERAAAVAHVAQNLYAFGESTLGVMPLYHTMGVRSLISMTLLNGLFVCLPRFDAQEALRLVAREKISTLYLVPTLYHDLIHNDAFASTDTASIRKLGFAGAPMTDALVRDLSSAFQPELFVNHYGSSEVYTFTVEQDAAARPGSAGRAGLNQEIRVVDLGALDPHALAQPGIEGQIIASLDGDESFAGYWQRPDADERSLVNGWYFTGDTGYFDEAGNLYVTGRVDDMIISGGENISPVEIESVLSLHPNVDEVAVVGLSDERWGQRVTAFVKPRGEVSDGVLDTHCLDSDLPSFKRPRDYVYVREIPKSPVGKILRRMLVAGDFERIG